MISRLSRIQGIIASIPGSPGFEVG